MSRQLWLKKVLERERETEAPKGFRGLPILNKSRAGTHLKQGMKLSRTCFDNLLSHNTTKHSSHRIQYSPGTKGKMSQKFWIDVFNPTISRVFIDETGKRHKLLSILF
jgi:hypothetical protein